MSRDPRFDRFLCQESVWTSVELLSRGRALPAPLTVEWHLTSACNQRCPRCVSRDLLNGPSFSRERARALAREMSDLGVRAVVLSGGGEPLCHSGVAEVAAHLARNDVLLGVVTNGLLLGRHEAVLAESCRFVRLSIDAATAATHRRVRPAAGAGERVFDDLLGNIERLTARGGCECEFSFVVYHSPARAGRAAWSNVGELAAAAKLARELGCDSFEVQLAFDARLQLAATTPALRRQLAAQLDEARALAREGFRVTEGAFVSALLEGGGRPSHHKPYARCPAVRLSTLVTPYGAFLCPYHSAHAVSYGDPHTSALKDLWRSAELGRVRDKIRPVDDCNFHCMYDPLNRAVLAALQDLRATGARPKLRPDMDLFI